MAEFELKITGSMAELFAIASRLGGATASPNVIAAEPVKSAAPILTDANGDPVVPQTETSVAALDTASAPRKRRTKAEIAADEAAAKPSAFETPVEPEPDSAAPADTEVADTSPPAEKAETSPPTSDASPAATPVEGAATYEDCHAMMDTILNKQKPPAGAADVQKAFREATAGEAASLLAIKDRPELWGPVYAALAAFKNEG